MCVRVMVCVYMYVCVCVHVRVCVLTDHEVGHTAEDDSRDGAQGDDVRQDLRQEVD